jgi:DNA-binding MarR family transcriptional regulator
MSDTLREPPATGATRVTDAQVIAMMTPLYAIGSGMSRAVAAKPQANRLAVLQAVAHGGPIRPSDIAHALNLHQSQVTRTVQALEQEDLVVVAADPADRRSWLIAVTDGGRAEIDRLTAVGLRRWHRFLDGWSLASSTS